jgi:hypothetical protein
VQVESAYAEAVAALLDATPDDAMARFDAELAAAVDAGRLDADTARTLRWWQRESVRAVRDHAAVVLPPVISGLVASSAGRQTGSVGGEVDDGPAEPDDRMDTENTAHIENTRHIENTGHIESTVDGGSTVDEARRRTLVAGLLAIPDAASA